MGPELFIWQYRQQAIYWEYESRICFCKLSCTENTDIHRQFSFWRGPGWVDKPFDIYTNSKNTIIGTRLNAFIHIMWHNEIKIADQFYMDANLGFMHLSNGGTTLPNLGLNTPGLSVGIKYGISDPVKEPNKISSLFTKKTGYRIYTTAGIKQWPWVGSDYYLINTVQAEVVKRFAPNHSYGGGIVLFYDRTLSHYSSEANAAPPHTNKMQAGIYASYEQFFWGGFLFLCRQGHIYITSSNRRLPSSNLAYAFA